MRARGSFVALSGVLRNQQGPIENTITVSTRRDGDWAEIRIGDTGTGIPEAVDPKVFDPFFTTKEVGKGTTFIVRLLIVTSPTQREGSERAVGHASRKV